MKKQFKLFIILMTVCLAAACFLACSKGEYDGKGSGEIVLTLSADYDGVQVDCPEGLVTGADKTYTVKVKTRNRTDVIVSCKGYHTAVVPVYTKDFVSGVARKTVTLEKRYNTVTLTVSGVADMSGVEVRAENENTIRETTVSGKKVTVTLNDFAISGEIDTLSVACNGYYTYAFGVKASDFVDYSASVKVNLLSTASSDAALTLINDLSGDGYYLNIKEYDALDSRGESCRVSKSTTLILDKTKNYLVQYEKQGYGTGYYPLAAQDFAATPYKTVRLSELKGLSTYNYVSYNSRVKVALSPQLRAKLNEYGNDFSDNWYYSFIAIIKEGEVYSVREYQEGAFVDGVKKGDVVRVVAASNRAFVADYTVTLGDTLTIEDRVENESKLRFRFFDTHGNRVDADENLVRLFNGYGSDKHFVFDDVEYVNATSVSGIATVSQDNKEIVLDWKQLMEYRSLYNDELYVENMSYLYLELEGERVKLLALFAKEYFDITVRDSFTLFLTLKDSDGNPLSDLRVTNWGSDAPIIRENGGYRVSVLDGKELNLDIKVQGANEDDIRYDDIRLLAYKEFFKYDTANDRYTLAYTVSRIKHLQIVNTGDALPPDRDLSVYVNNNGLDSLNTNLSEWFVNISEKHIGKELEITLYDNDAEYRATVKITSEMFESGVITVNIRRIVHGRG